MDPEMTSKIKELLTKRQSDVSLHAFDLESTAAAAVTMTHSPSHSGYLISSVDALPTELQEASQREQLKDGEVVIVDEGPIPDGGYGWIIVICIFLTQIAGWGMMTVYGVFISWFKQHDTFPGASIEYAWIAGGGVSSAFFISPFSSYICKLLPLTWSLAISQILMSAGFILAGLSRELWQFGLTQGLMVGIGIGLSYMATQPLISQWFSRRRALAMGLTSAGVGAGGLIFSITTRLALANLGVRIAYIINGVVVFVLLTPTTFLLKSRVRVLNPKFRTVRLGLLRNLGLVFVAIWSFLILFGYLVALLTVATYSTQGAGLSQAQAASIQALLAAGQLVGRPGLGLLLDTFGRIDMASLVSILAGVTCLCIWMFAKSYGLLLFFAFANGSLSGIFFSALGPVLSDVVGLKDLSDALAIIWLFAAPASLFSTTIAFALAEYSEHTLGKTGPAIFQISIGVAGGACILSGIVLYAAKRYQKQEDST